jgi:hypothetical protein
LASTSVVFDILARDRASDKFDHLSKSADGSTTTMSRFTGVMKTAGKAAAIGLAGGVVIGAKALVDMTQNAIEDEAAQRKLAIAMQNSVGATDKQVASVENWISKAGVATGVTDDELRPAFQRLVQATGSVKEAQAQMGIAMDVSAGTGKSLKVVTEALMKANLGTTASLSKLGLKTKDAEGNTLSLKDALAAMGDTFEGQAAAKADSLSGKMDRLRLIVDEAKESIGARLIPVVTDLADWLLATVVPAVEKFFKQWEKGVGTGGEAREVLEKLGNVLKDVTGFLWDNKEAVAAVTAAIVAYKIGIVAYTVYTNVASVATKAWAAAQWLLNAAMNANPLGLVITGLALLAAGLVLAYKKSETFREIVDGAMDAVGKAFTWFWNNVGQPVIKFFVTGLGQIIEMFADLVGAMSHVPGFGWLKPLAESMHNAADKTKELAESIKKIPDRKTVTISVLVNEAQARKAERILGDVTTRAMGGGLNTKGGGAGGRGHGIGLSGPGAALIENIVKGIEKGKVKLATALDKLKGFIQRRQDALADLLEKKSAVVEAFRGFTSSIFSTDLTAGEGEEPKGLAAILAFGAQQRANAEQLAANVKTLLAKGLSQDLIQQLVGAGEGGREQIALLAAGTAEDIRQANEDNAATVAALQEAGVAAGGALYDAAIAQEERDIKLADTIKGKLQELLDKQDENTVVELHLDGQVIHWSLKKLKRKLGHGLGLDD